ncbi:MAG: hypothetical protein JWP51_3190 [Bradyrhizobium sp.]|nr:hypothetical protein [Bradyrhizobium sp.]
MDVGAVQEIQIVIGIDMGAGLQSDDGAERFRVFECQVKRNAPADRAADQDRPVKFERGHDLEYHGRVLRRGEPVFVGVPA